jgi:hypothetical protein
MAGTRNDIFSLGRKYPGRFTATRPAAVALCLLGRFFPGRLSAAIVTALVMVLLVIDIPLLQAEMYICSDQFGAMNFTNVPNGSDCKPVDLKKKNGSLANITFNSSRRHSESRRYSGSASTRYDREIRRIGMRYNVDPSLIKAIIHTESAFDNQAVSHCGAQGLMQLMPGTAEELQVANPFNPLENIDGGTRYFRYLLDNFNEDLILSLAAYNAGPGVVTRTGGVPRIPETLQYINRVLKRYKVYKATW